MEGTEIQETHRELSVIGDPNLTMMEARNAARILADVIAKKSKPVLFNGEQYLEFEDWQTAGQFYGYAVKTEDAVPIEVDGIKGAKARAILFNKEGAVVGGAESYCMRDEANWSRKPWFQLASMAQTRAGSKAFRNRLSWVVVLAGYKTTPAEELDRETFHAPARASTPTEVAKVYNAVPVEEGPPDNELTLDQMKAQIKDYLEVMYANDQTKMNEHVKGIANWKDKETKEQKFLDLSGLMRLRENKKAWVGKLHELVTQSFREFAAKQT